MNTTTPQQNAAPQAAQSHIVPDGTYRGKALRAEYKKSSKQGTEYFEIWCQITMDGPYKGRQLMHEAWFKSDDTCERSMKTLETCGVDMTRADALSSMEGLGSVEVDLVVQVEDPQPRPEGGFFPVKNRIAFINEVGASVTGRLMTPQEKIGFDAKLAGLRLKMVQQGSLGAAKGAASQTQAPATPNNAAPQGMPQPAPAAGTGKFDRF